MKIRRRCIFDFDGVLLESEYAGNKQIADYLTGDRPSDHARAIDGQFHGPGRRRFPRRARALDRPAAARGFPRRARGRGCARDGRRDRARSPARSPSSARCRRPAQGGRVVELDALDHAPSRPSRPRRRVRRHDLSAAASMSRAASRRPTSISTPPTRSACRSPLRDHRGFAGRRRPARWPRARRSSACRRQPLRARSCRAAARARRAAISPTSFDEVAAILALTA